MRKLPLWAVLTLLSFAALSADASTAQAEKPLIVTSIRPLQLIVNDLAGDLVTSKVLVNAATSPHDFSLTIAQALMLSEADLLVWVGPKMESFLRAGVHAKNVLAMDIEEGDQGSMAGYSHDHPHADAHLWLSEYEVGDFVERLVAALIKLLPTQQSILESRKDTFLKQLEVQHQANRAALKPHLSQRLAVYHDAYQYLFEAYDVGQALSLTKVPHERLSAKRLNEAGKKMENAACLLAESAELRQAERYAKLFELPLVSVDLLASDPAITSFSQYLAELGAALKRCLQA